jgi:hypothetical protein
LNHHSKAQYDIFQLELNANDLLELPREISELSYLREFHIEKNRLMLLHPDFTNLGVFNESSVFKFEENPWIQAITDKHSVNVGYLRDYLKTDGYIE